MAGNRRPIFRKDNLFSTEGVGQLERRDVSQQGPWSVVTPQPDVMILVLDQADPQIRLHPSPDRRDEYTTIYGELFVLRTDDVRDKDRFWFQAPGDPERIMYGIIGSARWNMRHALSKVDFGVKMYRVRKGG